MSDKNSWQHLLDIVHQCGTGQIFGLFGDAINPLSDALRKEKGERFEWIGVRHEEVAAFAASAQAKLTGKLGVCASTVGPGAIHLLNGLYDAKMDHAPVLALTGQIPRVELGTDYHQEVNLDSLFADVCVYNQTVVIPEQMPRLGLLAAQTALMQRGVSHLSIPADVGPMKETIDSLNHKVVSVENKIIPSDKELQDLASLLNSYEKITILVGWGARGATTEIVKLAEKLKAPIIHSLKGKAVIDNNHDHWAGGIGMLGSPCGVHAMHDCDVLLMLGTDFPYRQFYPKGKKIAQVDIAPERLGKRCGLSLGVMGDVKSTVEALLPSIKDNAYEKFLLHAQKECVSWKKTLERRHSRVSKGRLHPQTVAHTINKYASGDALFTADTGECVVWLARYIEMHGEREFIASFNHATMANAMPHAIGLQALDRKRQVVAMCGDGGFSMLMSDFMTAVKYKLPIKVFVFNNGVLGFVKLEMEGMGYAEWGIRLDNPSFADCAKAMGGEGILVEKQDQLDAAIKRAFECDGPVVVDIQTNPEELVMPSEIEPAKAWGFAMSKFKELWSEKE